MLLEKTAYADDGTSHGTSKAAGVTASFYINDTLRNRIATAKGDANASAATFKNVPVWSLPFRAYQETLTDVSPCFLIEDTNIAAAHATG